MKTQQPTAPRNQRHQWSPLALTSCPPLASGYRSAVDAYFQVSSLQKGLLIPVLQKRENRQLGWDVLAKFAKCNEFNGCKLPMNSRCRFVVWSLI
jgi:hypothetical protein